MPHEAVIKRVSNGGTRSIKALVRQAKYLARATRGEVRPRVTLIGAQRHAFNPNTPDAIDPNRFEDFARRLYRRSGRLPAGNSNAELDHDLTMHFVISFPGGTDSAAAQKAGVDWAEHIFGHGYQGPDGNLQCHDFFLAFHADGNDHAHPHMHAVVDRVPYGGGNLLTLRQGHPHWSYEAMRFTAVDAAASRGIALVATSRSDRGIVNQRLTDAEYRAFLHANQGRQWTREDLKAYELSLMQRPIQVAENQRRRTEAQHLPYLDDTYDTSGMAPGPNEEPGGRNADELRRGCTPPPNGGGGGGGGGDGDEDNFRTRPRQPFEFGDDRVNLDDGDGAGAAAPRREQQDEPRQGTDGSSARQQTAPQDPAAGADAEQPPLTAESLHQPERNRDQVQAEQRRDLERGVRRQGREMEADDETGDNRRRKTPEQPHNDARRERNARRQADHAGRERDEQLRTDLPHREAGANRPAPRRPVPLTPLQQARQALYAAWADARNHRATPRGAGAAAQAWRRRERQLAETVRQARIEYTRERFGQSDIVTRSRSASQRAQQAQWATEQTRQGPITRAMSRAQEQQQNRTSGANGRGSRDPGGSRSNEPRSS